jgi:hypothetical protein
MFYKQFTGFLVMQEGRYRRCSPVWQMAAAPPDKGAKDEKLMEEYENLIF